MTETLYEEPRRSFFPNRRHIKEVNERNTGRFEGALAMYREIAEKAKAEGWVNKIPLPPTPPLFYPSGFNH